MKILSKRKDLVNNLIITTGYNGITLKIVLTKLIDTKQAKSMKNHFVKDNYSDVIDVFAKQVKIRDGIYTCIWSDKLIEKTLQKCKEASNMEIEEFMIRKFKGKINPKIY